MKIKAAEAIVSLLLLVSSTFAVFAVSIGGHDITFVSHTYDPITDTSTWTYKVTSGYAPSISHWTIAWCIPDAIVDSSDPGHTSYEDPDPDAGLTGIKFNRDYQDFEVRTVWFTLSGDYTEGEVTVAIKAGLDIDYGAVTGPLCVVGAADVAIEKTGADYAYEGDMVAYYYTVTNHGPNKAVNVHVVDNLLGQIALSGLTDEDGDGFYDDLAAGAHATGTATYTVPTPSGDITNTATVTSTTSDPNRTNNQDSWTVDVRPPPGKEPGSYINELWYLLIKTPDAQMVAFLTHTVDQGYVPRPADLPTLRAAGFTITRTVRIGYTYFAENNIVYPTSELSMRKALHRLIDKNYIVANIYAPLMGKCDYWLPPPSMFVNPDAPLATFNPGSSPTEIGTDSAASWLNENGFLMGTDPNPWYDPGLPWSAPYLRIDPQTGMTLAPIEYVTRFAAESPLTYEMNLFIVNTFRKAGVQINLVPKAYVAIIEIMTNAIPDDYTLLSGGLGIIWGHKSPEILYDLLQSEQFPLWNIWNYANEEMDYWANIMKGTLDIDEFKAAAYEMQELAARDEPFLPMLLFNQYTATKPGWYGIVNQKGVGAMNNFWSPMFMRHDPPRTILKRIMGAEITTLNPLTASTTPDWQILEPVMGGTLELNPYSMDYMWLGHREPPVQEAWAGPDDVEGTEDDGMITTVRLRNDLKWQDNHPVTAHDWEFCMELLKDQNNVRYRSYWQNYHHMEIIDDFTFKEYATERAIFRSESIDVGFLAPKHIWEPFIAGPDGKLWTEDDRHHTTWRGWEEDYPQSPGGTKLVGMGPFYYPKGSWQPTSVHVKAWRNWWGGRICPGDVTLNGRTDLTDLSLLLDAFGSKPGMPSWEKPDALGMVEMLGPAADIAPPSQIIAAEEIVTWIEHFGHEWGPGIPPCDPP